MSKYLQQSNEQLKQSSSMKHTGMSVIDENIMEETFDDAELDNLESASQIGAQPLALAPAPAKSPKQKKSKRASKSKGSSQSSDEKSPKKSLISTPSEASISIGSQSDMNLAPKEPERLDLPVDGPEPAPFESGSQVGIPPMVSVSQVDQASPQTSDQAPPQKSDQAPPQKGGQPLKKEVDINKPTYGRKTFLGSLMELTTMCTCCRNKDYVAPKAWQEEDYSGTDNWNPMADLRVIEEYYEDEEIESASQGEEEEDDDDEVSEGDETSGFEGNSAPPPAPEPPPAAPRDVK